ncbi:terpene synthase family protein [Micromonospora sp. KC721]|uniref:terpene synthase family protein n=1 Tax=Micromonospora sp. KC721 TaxID=2530380 RepID=UPI00104621C4|nr:terpene synthase family protein [Micromonospora sp. KC721]TDB73107.1 terpene synthase [Micromonospora sp. KC721]
MSSSPFVDGFTAASEQGRICALAARGHRDLQQRVAAYPRLFPDPPVDGAMLGALAMSTAFIAPWCTAEQLRIANRASLWVTAEDWQIDFSATSWEAVESTVSSCLAVADGGTPADDDDLGRFLAEIRDELATRPAFAALRSAWREEVRRMLTADAREWRWRSARTLGGWSPPTLAEYLDNADNYGASFVNVSHWIATSEPDVLAHLPELTAASREAQQAIRLVNDLASYERDVRSGDLNALMLGVDREKMTRHIADQLDRCRKSLEDLAGSCPQEALYLAREIGFTSGFYHGTDFWGSFDR